MQCSTVCSVIAVQFIMCSTVQFPARCLGRAGDKQRLKELGENMEGVRTFTEIQVHCTVDSVTVQPV